MIERPNSMEELIQMAENSRLSWRVLECALNPDQVNFLIV